MIRKMTIGGALLALSMGIGCAGATQELQAARDAYDQAAQGQAARVAPAKVWEAKQALQRAEQEHEDDPGSLEERDLAYIALRKANVATASANMKVAEQEKKNAQDQYAQVMEMQRDQSRVTLSQRERELERTRESLQTQQQELQQAREAREQLERQLGVALGSLEELATVERDEQDRLVITLSGEVLFGFDDEKLLPVAERRLQEVANVLKQYDEQANIVVEGHTDAIGPEDYNMDLSQARAQSVAEFLAEHGVERQAMKTVGRGENDPLAPNDSPENRANNRRVEIIIEDPAVTAQLPIEEGAEMEGQGPSEED